MLHTAFPNVPVAATASIFTGRGSFLTPKGRSRTKKNKRGFSLMEIVLVLVIVGILVAAFLNTYIDGQNTRRATEQASSYALISSKTRAMYESQGDFNGITPKVLIGLGVVPKTMVKGDNIVSAWETQVGVAPTNLNGNANDGVEFSCTVPRTMCAEFVKNASGMSARATVDGTVIKNVATGANNVNISNLEAACQGGSGGNVTVLLAQGR